MWTALFLAAWFFVAPLFHDATSYAVVPAAAMHNPTAAAEAPFDGGVIRVNESFQPDPNASDERRDAYARYVVAHEHGHLVCWRERRDTSEECADADAAALGFPPPR